MVKTPAALSIVPGTLVRDGHGPNWRWPRALLEMAHSSSITKSQCQLTGQIGPIRRRRPAKTQFRLEKAYAENCTGRNRTGSLGRLSTSLNLTHYIATICLVGQSVSGIILMGISTKTRAVPALATIQIMDRGRSAPTVYSLGAGH
jgi:hypothetical protein